VLFEQEQPALSCCLWLGPWVADNFSQGAVGLLRSAQTVSSKRYVITCLVTKLTPDVVGDVSSRPKLITLLAESGSVGEGGGTSGSACRRDRFLIFRHPLFIRHQSLWGLPPVPCEVSCTTSKIGCLRTRGYAGPRGHQVEINMAYDKCL
jgi:hypothetical protein